MGVTETLARHIDTNPAKYVRKRLADSAAELSKAGSLAATCVVLNDALRQFVELLYEQDTDGSLANVDQVTGRILVPCPWGSAGWRRWGLRAWEAEALRHILRSRPADGQRPALFAYNADANTWHLQLADWPHVAGAHFYLDRQPVKPAELRAAQSRYRDARITAQSRYRQRVIMAQLSHD